MSSTRSGELPSPKPFRVCMSPRSTCHSCSPESGRRRCRSSRNGRSPACRRSPPRPKPSCRRDGALPAARLRRPCGASGSRRPGARRRSARSAPSPASPSGSGRRRPPAPPAEPRGSTGVAVSRKMSSPQTTGDARPWPGTSTLKWRFSPSPILSGGFAAGALPLPSGPRHWGQWASAGSGAGAASARAASAVSAAIRQQQRGAKRAGRRAMMPPRVGLAGDCGIAG